MKLTQTTTHRAEFTPDEVKEGAIASARKQAGLGDDVKTIDTATIAPDGSVLVELVVVREVPATSRPAGAPIAKVDDLVPLEGPGFKRV